MSGAEGTDISFSRCRQRFRSSCSNAATQLHPMVCATCMFLCINTFNSTIGLPMKAVPLTEPPACGNAITGCHLNNICLQQLVFCVWSRSNRSRAGRVSKIWCLISLRDCPCCAMQMQGGAVTCLLTEHCQACVPPAAPIWGCVWACSNTQCHTETTEEGHVASINLAAFASTAQQRCLGLHGAAPLVGVQRCAVAVILWPQSCLDIFGCCCCCMHFWGPNAPG